MSIDKAIVKTSKENKAKWIYYKGRIQCFRCGWWNEGNDGIEIEKAIELWESHQCKMGGYKIIEEEIKV